MMSLEPNRPGNWFSRLSVRERIERKIPDSGFRIRTPRNHGTLFHSEFGIRDPESMVSQPPRGCALDMRRLACLVVAGLVGWSAHGPRASAAEGSVSARYDDEVRPVLEQYCYGCHGLGAKKGGVALDEFPDARAARNAPKLWHAVLKNVRSGIMPPADKPQPSAEERRLLEDWIKYGAARDRSEGSRPRPRHGPPAQPGRVPQHDPRPDRRRLRHHLRVPAGRHGARVRQHRRRPDALPLAAGEVPRGGARRSSPRPCRRSRRSSPSG